MCSLCLFQLHESLLHFPSNFILAYVIKWGYFLFFWNFTKKEAKDKRFMRKVTYWNSYRLFIDILPKKDCKSD